MFAHLFPSRPAPDPASVDRAFVQDVRVRHREPRNARAEKVILACWLLIAVKHVAVIWAVHRYAIPFHQLWINFPTFLLGLVATAAYYGRE